jgi:hypothetical protein
LDDHALVCRPCYFISCLTEEPWYAYFFECLVMNEFGEIVFSSSLGERLELVAEGGSGLAVCQCWESRGDIIQTYTCRACPILGREGAQWPGYASRDHL